MQAERKWPQMESRDVHKEMNDTRKDKNIKSNNNFFLV